jgi:flagellar protein FlgJ
MNNFNIDPRILLSNSTTPGIDKKTGDLQKLRKSSEELESLFIMEMFKAMRKAVPEGGLFEKSMATEMYQEMIDMETARSAASGNGMGIAKAMYQQLAAVIENRKEKP